MSVIEFEAQQRAKHIERYKKECRDNLRVCYLSPYQHIELNKLGANLPPRGEILERVKNASRVISI